MPFEFSIESSMTIFTIRNMIYMMIMQEMKGDESHVKIFRLNQNQTFEEFQELNPRNEWNSFELLSYHQELIGLPFL